MRTGFVLQVTCKKPIVAAHILNPNAEEAEAEGSVGLCGQPGKPTGALQINKRSCFEGELHVLG